MFTWSQWIGLVAVGLVVIAVIYVFAISDLDNPVDHIVFWVVALVVAGVLYNGGTAFASANVMVEPDNKYRQVTDRIVAEEYFGFKANTPYPLVLGSQVAAFQASAEAESGFFSSAQASARGGPAITVAFTYEEMTYTLSLPRDATPIKIDDSKTPQMIIHFLPWTYTAGGFNLGKWSNCEWVISNLAAACKRTLSYEQQLLTRHGVRDAGLGKLVSSTFHSAELTMTSAMYQHMIGEIK